MKPRYWIGIMALAGAIIGYAFTKITNGYDLGTFLGTIIGTTIGTVIYSRIKET